MILINQLVTVNKFFPVRFPVKNIDKVWFFFFFLSQNILILLWNHIFLKTCPISSLWVPWIHLVSEGKGSMCQLFPTVAGCFSSSSACQFQKCGSMMSFLPVLVPSLLETFFLCCPWLCQCLMFCSHFTHLLNEQILIVFWWDSQYTLRRWRYW